MQMFWQATDKKLENRWVKKMNQNLGNMKCRIHEVAIWIAKKVFYNMDFSIY